MSARPARAGRSTARQGGPDSCGRLGWKHDHDGPVADPGAGHREHSHPDSHDGQPNRRPDRAAYRRTVAPVLPLTFRVAALDNVASFSLTFSDVSADIVVSLNSWPGSAFGDSSLHSSARAGVGRALGVVPQAPAARGARLVALDVFLVSEGPRPDLRDVVG